MQVTPRDKLLSSKKYYLSNQWIKCPATGAAPRVWSANCKEQIEHPTFLSPDNREVAHLIPLNGMPGVACKSVYTV